MEENIKVQYSGSEEEFNITGELEDKYKADKCSLNPAQLRLLLDFKNYKIENLIERNKELERQIKIKNAYLTLINNIAYDYDGCNTVKSLKELIDELVKMCNQAYKNDDWSVMFIGANNTNKNILQELLKDFEQTGNHIPHID